MNINAKKSQQNISNKTQQHIKINKLDLFLEIKDGSKCINQ